ncbi:MAG: DUF1559 domain-containing protein [Isosphaeraceae bacterium]
MLAQAASTSSASPGLPAVEYRPWLVHEAGAKGAFDLPRVTSNLGLAQYRAGRYEDAIKTLARAIDQRLIRDQAPPFAVDVALSALAQARLGRVEAAREALDYLGESATNPEVQNDEFFQGLFKDAETVVGSDLATRRRRAIERLTVLGRAYGQVATKAGKLVPTDVRSRDGKPLLSWRVALLPALGQEALYREFHLDESWDSPHNKALLGRMPEVFVSPHDPDRPGMTHVALVKGKGTACDPDLPDGVPIRDVKDGTINTLLFVESSDGIPWTEPRDVEFEEGKPVPKLGAAPTGRFTFMLVNGSAGALRYEANREILPQLMRRSDGQPQDFRAAVKP